MSLLIYPLPGAETLAARLIEVRGGEAGQLHVRRFPGGESYFRLDPEPRGRSVVFIGSLDDPDAKSLRLLMMAETARELGARRVGLVAPYLAYMRQDRRFAPGEPVSARLYAGLISRVFDWLVTVDPHLHRIPDLAAIYPIQTRALHAAPAIADWIAQAVERPLIVGPDEESAQWVAAVAGVIGAPWAVMTKRRLGDREVVVEAPDLTVHAGRNAVLVDDVVTSGRTLAEGAVALGRQHLAPRFAVVVHALAEPEALRAFADAGLELVSTDSVPHPSNRIALAELIGPAVSDLGPERPD